MEQPGKDQGLFKQFFSRAAECFTSPGFEAKQDLCFFYLQLWAAPWVGWCVIFACSASATGWVRPFPGGRSVSTCWEAAYWVR